MYTYFVLWFSPPVGRRREDHSLERVSKWRNNNCRDDRNAGNVKAVCRETATPRLCALSEERRVTSLASSILAPLFVRRAPNDGFRA